MNFSTLIGFVASIAVFISSAVLALSMPEVLLDSKSLLVVLGGTVSASLICFPLKEILVLIKVFVVSLFKSENHNYKELIEDIVSLSKAKRDGPKNFETAIGRTRDAFLKEGAGLLFWSASDIQIDEIRDLLETRAATIYKDYDYQANYFKTMSKFPPAFGLLGTTLGMIALLQSLGDNVEISNIGPSMAVALITTFYGVAFANFLLIPIGESLSGINHKQMNYRSLVIESLILIAGGKPTKYVEEKAKSFLLPSKRKEISK